MSAQKLAHRFFIAVLFRRVKKWKQSESPSTEKCVNKYGMIYTMEYYSALKNKELIHAMTWMNLENMLSEKSKPTHCMIPFIKNVQNKANLQRKKIYS